MTSFFQTENFIEKNDIKLSGVTYNERFEIVVLNDKCHGIY